MLSALAGCAGQGDDPITVVELRELMGSLAPLLGPGSGTLELPPEWVEAWAGVRADLLAWLRKELGLELVSPSERSLFVPGVMEVAGTRRTAHPHEQGTVAKVEQPGLLRNGQVFLPARVVRYEAEDDW